jgi:hypothetical protein
MMTRLQFLRSLGALGLAAAAAPALVACSSEGDDTSTPDAGGNNGSGSGSGSGSNNNNPDAGMNPQTCSTVSAAIGTNHGHAMTVPAADVAAGVEKTYQIQGSSGHPHTVKVTGPLFAMLKQNGTITVTSSKDADHTHSVTLTCG